MVRRKRRLQATEREDIPHGPARWFGSTDKGLPAALNLVVLILTIIASTYGAIYLVFPHLQPKAKLGASIDRIVVEQDVSFGQWRARKAGSLVPPPPLPDDPPYGTPGLLTLIHVQVSGFKSRLYSAEVVILASAFHLRLDGSEAEHASAFLSWRNVAVQGHIR